MDELFYDDALREQGEFFQDPVPKRSVVESGRNVRTFVYPDVSVLRTGFDEDRAGAYRTVQIRGLADERSFRDRYTPCRERGLYRGLVETRCERRRAVAGEPEPGSLEKRHEPHLGARIVREPFE